MNIAPDFFDSQTRNWRARLATSVDVMRELSQYSDPVEMYQIFNRRMGQLFPTDRQITLSRRGVDHPKVRVTRYSGWSESANPFSQWDRFPVLSGGLFADLLYSDEPRLISSLVLPSDDPSHEYLEGQHSLLAIPVFEQGVGANMVVVTREEPHGFRPEQVPELVWMTNLFGRATQTLVLTNALREAYEAADSEIRAIAALQQSLLPIRLPSLAGLDVAVHYRAAQRAGGDYYDFFPLPDGAIGALVADVSGHGTPAAVLMAITHSIAHAANAPHEHPGAMLTHLNARLSGTYNRNCASFVTAFAAVFDPKRNTLRYASAGHVPPRLLRAKDGMRVPLNRVQRLPLGISPPGAEYPEFVTEFHPGDQVILFTDGITEAVSRGGDVFGVERLDFALAAGPRSADDLLANILMELDTFTIGGPPADDRTLLVVRRT